MMLKPWMGLWVLVGLTGCATHLSPKLPELPLALPEQAGSMVKIDPEWWRAFQDPQLTDLVDEALRNNQNLALTSARIDEAQATLNQNNVAGLPQLGATVGTQRGHGSAKVYPYMPAQTQTNYKTALLLNWELDVWGRLRQTTQASWAQWQTQSYLHEAARLSLAAQVAQTYLQILANQEKLATTEESIRTRQAALALRNKRFKQGLTSELDVRQAEAELNQALLLKPQLSASVQVQKNALGVLLGRSPHDLIQQNIHHTRALPTHTPNIPADLSSDLLLRRPDIAASEAQLRAANAQIGIVRATYFPSISLTGTLGSSSDGLKNLLGPGAGLWNLASNLVAPIFNWNQNAAQVDAASARQNQALAQYTQTVQYSFAEVLDGLSQQEAAQRLLETQYRQIHNLERSVALSNTRYQHGYVNHLEVLDAERQLLQAKIALTDAKLARLTALIQLYKALGGGWERPSS